MKLIFLLSLFSLFAFSSVDSQWSANFEFKHNGKWALENRANPYKLDDSEFQDYVLQGKYHTLKYPIDNTPLLFSYSTFEKAFDERPVNNKARKFIYRLLKISSGYKSKKQFFKSAGHNEYPEKQSDNYSNIPYPEEKVRGLPMGGSLIKRHGVEGLTFGCASCHSGNLFGKKILGLTARFPKGNQLFIDARKARKAWNPVAAKFFLGLNDGEIKMMNETMDALYWSRAMQPLTLGLDTSLAQVGVSLHYRAKDEYASKIKQRRQEKHALEKKPADSKPAVWWNLKYKTRWLSDGSVVSGNPVYTNFIWNEVGRGADLKELESWIDKNSKKVEELTTAVFATKPPKYLDFFDEKDINLQAAMRGEKHFKYRCQKCHGQYIKNWSLNDATMSKRELIETKEVRYHKKTPVKNVGTDPARFEGMKYFSSNLNRLALQKNKDVLIVPQKGYVPPPLVGIWARWPYFHNNSVPSLCALLTESSKRPKVYWSMPAENKDRDFDKECNGYPVGDKVPEFIKKEKKYFYDTSRIGMRNTGHDKKIFLDANGKEYMSKSEKMDLIEFLKTL